MNVSFEEIGRLAATFAHEGCASGQVCKVIDNAQVGPCNEGDDFCGFVESVRGGFAAVQVAGFVTVSVSGPLDAGYMQLCADGAGGVMAGEGRKYLVVAADKDSETAVIML